jgi:hypothetical protein
MEGLGNINEASLPAQLFVLAERYVHHNPPLAPPTPRLSGSGDEG